MSPETAIPSSFRDPCGFVFEKDGEIYRQVNRCYQRDFDLLKSSGLMGELQKDGLLIAHEELSNDSQRGKYCYKILKPERLPFISYPYEWCFSQLKDAALLTLEIQSRSLHHGMILKDASAYNIQFKDCRPVMIDTLSFSAYSEGSPWVAYKQFCQHFLAPLSLLSYRDPSLGQLLQTNIDGIPLDLAANLLPKRSYLNLFISMHIHMHAHSQSKYSDVHGASELKNAGRLKRKGLEGIIDSLKSCVSGLHLKNRTTQWQNYYNEHNYSGVSFKAKQKIVESFLKKASPSLVFDLGANVGHFSRLAGNAGARTISIDLDPQAVEINYQKVRSEKEKNILPLLIDLRSPSPSIGWANQERQSLSQRGPADLIMALALIHHLAIANNLPLSKISQYFSNLADWAIVEFVEKGDSQVQKLLAAREDIFADYTREGFEKSFSKDFSIEAVEKIEASMRTLYLLRKLP